MERIKDINKNITINKEKINQDSQEDLLGHTIKNIDTDRKDREKKANTLKKKHKKSIDD